MSVDDRYCGSVVVGYHGGVLGTLWMGCWRR